jgi:hypothetical protein
MAKVARRKVTRRVPAWKHLAGTVVLAGGAMLLLHFADRTVWRQYVLVLSGALVFVSGLVAFTAGMIEYDARE